MRFSVLKVLLLILSIAGILLLKFEISSLLNDPVIQAKSVNSSVNSTSESENVNATTLDITIESSLTEQAKIDELLKANQELEDQVNALRKQLSECSKKSVEPSLEYEKQRRRLIASIKYFWEEFKYNMKNYLIHCPKMQSEINDFYKISREHKVSWLSNIHVMTENDGYQEWRVQESKALEELVQKRLNYIQNPPDCSNRKYIKCPAKYCGWGCQVHFYTECLIVAYKMNRTVIMDQTGFAYNKKGWNQALLPISDTCKHLPVNVSEVIWPGFGNETILRMTNNAAWRVKSDYPARRMPKDIADRVEKFNTIPMAWWNGQVQKYFQKYTPPIRKELDELLAKIGFDKPIAGIHVRRTDKLYVEAKNYSIADYMVHVEEYFDQLEISQKIDKRRIYVSTDDPYAIIEVREKYPKYEVYSNEQIAKDAGEKTRYTYSSLIGLLKEIEILSYCTYLVCTFSSNVCRLVYENMQTMYPDATNMVKSLDYSFFTASETLQKGKAILRHESAKINLTIGDSMEILAMNDSIIRDTNNLSTKKSGKVPSFKVEFDVQRIEYPTYPEVG